MSAGTVVCYDYTKSKREISMKLMSLIASAVMVLSISAFAASQPPVSAADAPQAVVADQQQAVVDSNAAPVVEKNISVAKVMPAPKAAQKDFGSSFGPMAIIFLLLALIALYIVKSGNKKMKIKNGKLVEEESTK